jgi:hypothetical protein
MIEEQFVKKFNRRQQTVGKMILLNLLLLIVAWFWPRPAEATVRLAIAKGGQPLAAPALALNQYLVEAAALTDPALTTLLAGKRVELVEATPLSAGEARPWQVAGCGADPCAHLVLYNYTDGGTVEAVVNLASADVVAHWSNPTARPGGTPLIAHKAVAIAAADPGVTAVLGDIHQAEQAMVPMSGWLADDDCRDQWCVDLTFADPAGSGRVFHVFVNMEQGRVARTFYTRARAELPRAKPAPQRYAYTDGCHEQYGWNVCWEMTANDGVNFRDATYNGTAVFSSAKVGQIEAWYPSWPGGYRDEIGFSSSVPPFGDTEINDFGDSFEVRQLFTEFTRWPNCICCYRYEEIMRFYDDGSFEPRFVSHGPGCDDLSIYRPLWRIDLAPGDQPVGNQVWLWENNTWLTATAEFETYPFITDVAPTGAKVATQSAGQLYTWQMLPTDPLGLDEARFFAQAKKEDEGVGPITPGPGDTFQPPRQWIDGDTLTGQDLVLWFVPLLKTKKGDPWWCMPDPEPEVNQCEAILRIEPAQALPELSAEQLAAQQAATATAVAPPTAVVTPAPSPTPRAIEGDDAAEIILNAGCGSCHKIGALGEQHKVGPDLSNIGNVAEERVAGLSAEAYLRQSILEPNAYIAPDCPNGPCLPNIMPGDYGTRLTAQQVDMIVAFLLAQRGEEIAATATPARIGADRAGTPAPKAEPFAKRGQPASGANITVQILLVSLVFLLTLFRLLKSPSEA